MHVLHNRSDKVELTFVVDGVRQRQQCLQHLRLEHCNANTVGLVWYHGSDR